MRPVRTTLFPLRVCLGFASLLVAHLGLCGEKSARSAPEFAAALREIQPGDTVWLEPGTWKDAELDLSKAGTATQPIAIKARQSGQTVLTGNSSLTFSAPWVHVEGLFFTNGARSRGDVITFASDHCRLTNTAVVDFNPADSERGYYWVYFKGSDNRVEHCYFAGKNHHQPLVGNDFKDSRRNSFARSHFKAIAYVPKNGREVFRIWGYGGNEELGEDGAFFTVEENLFEDADGEGAEIVSLKSNRNVVRGNTILRTRGGITNRSGNFNTIVGNTILCDGKPGAYGMRITGRHHKISDNYISDGEYGIHLLAGEFIERDLTGRYKPIERAGTPLGRVPSYNQPADVIVERNTIVNSAEVDLYVGKNYKVGWPEKQYVLLPDRIRIESNFISKPAGGIAVEAAVMDPAEPFSQFRAEPATFAGNVVDGGQTKALPSQAGLDQKRIVLEKGADGVSRPVEKWDVGASVGTVSAPVNRRLTENDVGPEWVRNRRSAGDATFK